jgi:hypothetical protein
LLQGTWVGAKIRTTYSPVLRLQPFPDSWRWNRIDILQKPMQTPNFAIEGEMEHTWIAEPRVQLCDEYEVLLTEFLKVLTTWSQLREFGNEGVGSTGTPEPAALFRADRRYVAALWALRMHERTCAICGETLRVQAQQGVARPARISMS